MRPTSEVPTASYQPSEKQDLESQTPIVEKSLAVDTPSEKDSSIKEVKLTRKQVWKKRWDRAVRQGWWPRVLYSTFGLVVGAIWIGITVYFSNSEKKWNRSRQKQAINKDHIDNPFPLFFDGSLKKFDQSAKTLTVSWSATFINFTNYTDPNSDYNDVPLNFPLEDGGPLSPYPIDVYRDVDTTVINVTSTNSTLAGFYWVIANTSIPHIATVGNTEDDNFDTDIDFQATDSSNVWRQPLFGYPLDQMTGSITLVTSYSNPGTPLNFTTSVFPFDDARLTDYSFNWRFNMSTESICLGPWNYTGLDPIVNDSAIDLTFPCHLAITFTATRPPLVQFAVAMAVIVNWTSTLFIFVLTCESLLMRRGWMLSGTDLLGVTFTSLFALPTVRMLLPGAPDFGVLVDLIGIIPNVIVISLCIVAIAVAKLNRRNHKEEDTKNKAD